MILEILKKVELDASLVQNDDELINTIYEMTKGYPLSVINWPVGES